jgi:hypothetical protein
MPKKRDENYMNIAKACLQAVNNTDTGANRAQQVQAVYSAIDQAISDLYNRQDKELKRTFHILQLIAELDPTRDNLEHAITLAQAATQTCH